MLVVRVVAMVMALGLVVWAWRPALEVGFLADDYEWFAVVKRLSWEEVGKLFWYPALGQLRFARYRPLTGFFFWLDYQLWGYWPGGYHLTNLTFHGVAVTLVFFLAREFWRRAGGRNRGLSEAGVGILASSLFAINPLLPEAVTWIDGRYDVISSAFFLLGLLGFLWGLRKPKWKGYLFGGGVVAVTLSLLAKETALVFPVLLLILFIYYGSLRYRKVGFVRLIREVLRMDGGWLVILLGVVVAYGLGSSMLLGKPFWLERGYGLAVSRPFLLWLLVTGLWITARLVRGGRLASGLLEISWLGVGMTLLPVGFLPTQARFLYLPLAFACLWVAFFLASQTRRWGVGFPLFLWAFVVVVSAIGLRRENLNWQRASLVQRQAVMEIHSLMALRRPSLIYLFNFPDSVGRVPVFRSYVGEAVALEQGTEGMALVVGPTTADLSDATFEVVGPREVRVKSDSGFTLFPPAVVEKFLDGSTLVDWEGKWRAKFSTSPKEATVTFPIGLDERGVLALVFDDGRVKEISQVKAEL